jgi:hypothetical protein
MSEPNHIFEQLHEREIKFEISTMWDDNFRWRLGDDLSGYEASGEERSFAKAVESLTQAAQRYFPECQLVQ